MDEVSVRRSDPIYNAHGYLTKVPVDAIVPFLERYTAPGALVLDVFAGSGMTGVAAVTTGRRAILVDISELGRHVGSNYLRLLEPDRVAAAAHDVVERARARTGDIYAVQCVRCGAGAELSRTIWSLVYECTSCCAPVVFYDATDAGREPATCRECGSALHKRSARRLSETPTVDVIACACSPRLLEQSPGASPDPLDGMPEGLVWPDIEIPEDREMFRRSALRKHGLTSTATFFSGRNLIALAALREAIAELGTDLREKLMFAFTAILPRASKRYQWSPKRPLNAQNQTYYVSPVFLEWNVFDLFTRKVTAILRSDDAIRERVAKGGATSDFDVEYRVASADNLSFLEDESVDYVFTDPPFGSNIFYSDMNLFQEAWLGRFTDPTHEAVIPTNGRREHQQDRYETLLTGALSECFRVLKRGGALSLVFSNSSGAVWAVTQRAIQAAGFELEPDGICLLDKGQRSVKGLASGYEKVVTTDLVMTMRRPAIARTHAVEAPTEDLRTTLQRVMEEEGDPLTPSRAYLRIIRRYLRNRWDVADVDFGSVLETCASLGLEADPASGTFRSAIQKATTTAD